MSDVIRNPPQSNDHWKWRAEKAEERARLYVRTIDSLSKNIEQLQAANAALEARFTSQRETEKLFFRDQSRMAKQIAALEGNLAAEREKVAALQARIDALMLEYCPAEMTQAQRDNWEAHQCVK